MVKYTQHKLEIDMVKVAGVKIKKKAPRAKRRTTGMVAMPVNSGWHACAYYVHNEVESREWGGAVKDYVLANWSKDDAQAVNRLPDWKTGMHSGWATAAWLLTNGFAEKVHPDYIEGLPKRIDGLVIEGRRVAEVKKTISASKKQVYIPTIQERLFEAAEEKTSEIDEWLDNWMRDKTPLKDKDIVKFFHKHEINLGHMRFISKWYSGPMEELQELVALPKSNKQDDMQQQLAEGYSIYSKAEIKELLDFYTRLFNAIEIFKAEKKQTRAPRKAKVKSATDQVKNLKFNPSDSKIGIASINPADVIDATCVVVFNTKNRKLGVYYAEDSCTIKVKGTTLQYYDEKKSVQRTVRKPEEIMPQWKKVTRHKVPAQFGYLKTTETKLNGRFNADTIILKAFK